MKDLANIRCGHCNRILARGHMESGHMEIKCPRCSFLAILRATSPNIEPHDGLVKEVRHAHSSAQVC